MAFYAFNRRGDDDLAHAEAELMISIDETYDLYHFLLLLILELSDIAGVRISKALQKKIPTEEDLNPQKRFVNNQIIAQLGQNLALKNYTSSKNLSWNKNSHLPRLLYNKMIDWEVYQEYMKSGEITYNTDKRFIIRLVTDMFANSEDLLSNLEEQSIYWNDDIEYVSVMIEKTLKKFKPESRESFPLLPLYKNDEDEEFVKTLFRKTVLHSEKCSELIDKNTTNWEVERIALMDILVMQLAITEMLEFPEIPVKVTLNEYIEIAKDYSTEKSSFFINGVLDKILKDFTASKRLHKIGRGLL